MSGTILIVDDDPVQRRLLEAMVQRFGYQAVTAESGTKALDHIFAADPPVDLVVLDLTMPDLDGFGVLDRLRSAKAQVPVIVQTVNHSIDAVISAMRGGAMDFVVKPVGPERLQISIRNALKTGALEHEVRAGARQKTATLTFADLGRAGGAMAHAVALGERAAQSTIPVLLEGETGTGKELLARAISASGDRAGRPFVVFDCGTVMPDQAEQALFGNGTDRGKFAEAQGGTLFLDEIGELPPQAQAVLARALQDGEDGASARDIRIISASGVTLVDLVRAGRFRDDLYYRLGVFPIAVPPLRHRREDIGHLARRFLARFAAEEGRRVRAIAPAAMALLETYDWPGNVRQLENALFRAVVLADGDELTMAEFPQIAAALGRTAEALPPTLVDHLARVRPAAEPRNRAGLPLTSPDGHARPLAEIERDTIRHAIAHYGGQMTEVARRLGIGRSTLYRKLKELDLEEACGTADTQADEPRRIAKA